MINRITKRGLSVLILLLAGISIGGNTIAQDWQTYADDWMSSGQYYDTSYRTQYYPYFGEDFFTSGYDTYKTSQEAIAAQRQVFEYPFLPYFGEGFLGYNEPYRFTYPGPMGVFPMDYDGYYYYPYYYPWSDRPLMKWSTFRKNWTTTMNYARANSSFRVLSSGYWRTV